MCRGITNGKRRCPVSLWNATYGAPSWNRGPGWGILALHRADHDGRVFNPLAATYLTECKKRRSSRVTSFGASTLLT
jgi:hypothetical protein